MPALPPLRYLPAADVEAAMPDLPTRLALAERVLTALATPGASQLPAKIGVSPRPSGTFAHAMPAHLRADDPSRDLLGLKWVTGSPGNAAAGIAAINAVVVLADPATGVATAILDGGPITAERTAAVSGVAISRYAPAVAGRAMRVGLVGAGVQGRSHVAVLAHLLPGLELRIHDRHPERAEALAAVADDLAGPGSATVAASDREAIEGADVVVTAASFTTPDRRQRLGPDWLAPDALVVSIDYATYCSAAVVRDAALFLVDERGQFFANRDAGQFDGFPDPTATLGEAILAGTPRPAGGRVVVDHLGVGLADVVFGAEIVRAAELVGAGLLLPR